MAELKIGNAYNEEGKRFVASDKITEEANGLYWDGSLVLTASNLVTSESIIGNGTTEAPLDWKGFSIRDSQGNTVTDVAKALKAGNGLRFTDETIHLLAEVDLSSYSRNSICLTGGNTKLQLNGQWSLQDGNAVKLASESASAAYLFSTDTNTEYPVIKAKSNAGGAEREYLLLDGSGKVPENNRTIASSENPGEVKIDENSLNVDNQGLLSWKGFTAYNSSGENQSSEIKAVKAGNNTSFSVENEVLTIASETGVTVGDSSLTLDNISKLTFGNARITMGADGEVIVNFNEGSGGNPTANINPFANYSHFNNGFQPHIRFSGGGSNYGNIGQSIFLGDAISQSLIETTDFELPLAFHSSTIPV